MQTGSQDAHAHYFPPILHRVSYACSLHRCVVHSCWFDYLDVGLAGGCCLFGPFEHGRSAPHAAFLWILSALHSKTIVFFSDLAVDWSINGKVYLATLVLF